MKWNISFLVACVLIGGISSLALRDKPVVEEAPTQVEVMQLEPEVIEEQREEIAERTYEVVDLPESAELSDEEVSEKLSIIMKLKKERNKKEGKEEKGKKKSLKEALADYKQMKRFQEFYEDIETRHPAPAEDPLIVAFGNAPRIQSIAPSFDTESSSSGYVNNDEEMVEEDHTIEIKTWKNKNTFIYGSESVDLYASIRSNGTNLPAQIDGEVFNHQHVYQSKITYYREQGDVYHANYSPMNKSSKGAGKYYVRLAFEVGKKKYRFMESFSVNQRNVIFFNRVQYEVTDQKNLKFKAFCNVLQSGVYLFQAALYDANDEFVAIAETPIRANGGIKWIELSFPGSIFYSKKLNGPFTLKNFAIYTVNDDLSSTPQEMIEVGFVTSDHSWEEFSSGSGPFGFGKSDLIKQAISLD